MHRTPDTDTSQEAVENPARANEAQRVPPCDSRTWLGRSLRATGQRVVRYARAAARRPWLVLWTLIALYPCALLLSISIQSLRGPLYGIHEWRQGWTYSVAYAFVHEHASFFYPKHAWRGHLTGIVGMEPPIYPWVVSLLMRVFGDSPLTGRLLNFTLFVASFALFTRRLGQRLGYATALGFLVMASFSPAVLAEFRQFQPDPAMAALAVIAAVLFADHGRTGARTGFLLGLAVYTIALLTKPIAVAIMPAMFLFTVLGAARPSLLGAGLRLASFAIPLGLMMAWDKWANVLVARYMEGMPLISIDHNPAQMWAEMKNPVLARLILLGLIENWVTHVALFPAVLLGVPYGLRKETRSLGIPFLAWFSGMVVISLAFSSRYPSNWYYMLLFAPPLAFFGALGLARLFEVIGIETRDPLARGVAIAVVLAALATSPLLVEVPWDHIEHIAPQLAVHVRHGVSGDVLYWVALVGALLVGAACVALGDWLDRVPRGVLAIVLAAASVWVMITPYKDLKQTVRFYTGELDWDAGHVDSAEIRRAVDRYSTPRDLFVMNGSNPALLVRALRVGYADDPGWIDHQGRDFYVQKGARFFMTFAGSPPIPVTMQGAQLLERGARWELYCIDPKGCPVRAQQ